MSDLASPHSEAYATDMATARLSPDLWLTAGLAALQHDGPAALGAEPLARALKTTKGSFYWHFKDVPAFHAAVLAHWRTLAVASLAETTQSALPPDQALRQFGRDLLADPVEPRLRSWAQNDPSVANVLATVDTARLDHLRHLLADLGFGNQSFAHALQAALIGLPQLAPADTAQQQASFDTLIDTVLALS